MIPKRPQYDPQHSFSGAQEQMSQKQRRPQFDPQNSHNDPSDAGQRQHLDRQPTIPAPQFTSFDVESALPPVQYEQEPSVSPPVHQPQVISSPHKRGNDSYHVNQHLHQSSISPTDTLQQDPWTNSSTTGNPRESYVPPPEQQHLSLSQHDGQSISATDSSSNAPGKSTPDSQQTSNTSHKDYESRLHPSGESRQGDDSFYWHSGRSSSDANEDHTPSSSPVATPGEASTDQRSSTTNSTVVQREHHDLPIRSTSLSPSAPYGASALGFGGPSDWEYFGDYEAEEIDDEELYSRPRPRDNDSAFAESVELPADHRPTGSAAQLAGEIEMQASRSLLQEVLPSSEEASVEHLQTSQSSDFVAQKSSAVNIHARDKSLSLVDSHVTPRPDSNGPLASSDQSPEQRLDLDEVIRAWSEAPDVGKLSAGSHRIHDGKDFGKQSNDVAEAALVSTPREKMLDANSGPKSAPSLPSLPATPAQLASLEEQSRVNRDSSTISLKSPLIPQDLERREQQACPPNQQDSSSGGPYHDTEQAHQPSEIYSQNQTKKEAKAEYAQSSPSKSDVSSFPSHTVLAETMVTKPSHVIEGSDPNLKDVSPDKKRSSSDTVTQVDRLDVPQKSPFVESSKEPFLAEPKANVISQGKPSLVHGLPEATLQDPMREPPTSELASLASVNCSERNYTALHDPVSQEPSQVDQSSLPQEHHSDLSIKVQPHKTPLEKPEVIDNLNAIPLSQQEAPDSSIPQRIMADVPTKAGANDSDVVTKCDLHNVEDPGQSSPPATSSISLRQPIESSSNIDKTNDPYADLDPWGKASLNRFAAMLREESRAETNKDKLNIFNVFTSRESRLRVVLYGTEDELVSPQKMIDHDQAAFKAQEAPTVPEVAKQFGKMTSPEKNGFVKQAVQRANTMSLQRSLKALPALPTNRSSVIGLPGNALAPLVVRDDSKPTVDDQSPTSDSSIDGAQYSPGGRPIITRTSREMKADIEGTPQRTAYTSEATAGAKDASSSSSNAPIAIGSKDTVEVAKKAAYLPPKYNEPRSEVNKYLANRKSVIRPYASLTQGSMDSGSNFGRGSDVSEVPSANTTIIPPTSQYNSVSKLKAGGDISDSTTKPKALANESQPDLRRFVKADFDPLLTILPQSEAAIPEPRRLEDLRNVMETIPDDFTFIHQSVVAWDAKAKKQREDYDRQRHVRQIESEQRIDSLFDDHEIGYGDISELEAEFKRSEAARKADEDRSEYQMFVSDVFTLVWTRLHYELDQLIPHYEQYSKLMNGTLAGRDMFEESSDGLALAPTMNLLLTLHQKLEIRHQKAFEAVLERDRRLKKTEISPWYTLSNIEKVKHLEKQFEDAEKKAIIEYCQQRNTRANRLMDVLDQNTLRGVGTNQDYMEAIWKAVRRIASGRAFASVSGSSEPTAGMEEVEKAKAVTALLATSSEQIVQTFHVADMLLNSADYEVSVARAKVTDKMDLAALAKLKEERAKEDQKLMRELEHRLALVREDTRRTNDEIVKLMLFLGISNGRADSAPAVHAAGLGDPDHEVRLQKALEEAKKRNALKESGN